MHFRQLRSIVPRVGRSRSDHGGLVARRERRLGPVVGLLTASEPRSTMAVSDLLSAGLRPWRGRAWTIERDGEPVGVVVVVRKAFDLWFGHVLLLDPSAAGLAAQLIDASPVVALNGAAPDIRPLMPSLQRLDFANVLPWIVESYPHEILDASDEGTRLATLADLDELVDLYRDYEYGYERTIGQLRSVLEHILREFYVIVAEEDGRIVGSSFVVGRTTQFMVGDGLTVKPEARGKNVMWHIAARMQAITNSMGLGAMAFLAASNPVLVDTVVQDDEWIAARLRPARRFPGHNRLRTAAYRRRGRSHRQPTYYRDPSDPDRLYVPKAELSADGKLIRR